jgi:hypothetical protein
MAKTSLETAGMIDAKRLWNRDLTDDEWLELIPIQAHCDYTNRKISLLNKKGLKDATRAAEAAARKDGTAEKVSEWRALQERDYTDVTAERRILEGIAWKYQVENVHPVVIRYFEECARFMNEFAAERELNEREFAETVGVDYKPSDALSAVQNRCKWIHAQILSIKRSAPVAGENNPEGRGCKSPQALLREIVDFDFTIEGLHERLGPPDSAAECRDGIWVRTVVDGKPVSSPVPE